MSDEGNAEGKKRPRPDGRVRDRYGRRKKAARPVVGDSAAHWRVLAANARDGEAPPGSRAAALIADAERGADFTLALQLRGEVKERAADIDRMADAAERRERKAAKRRGTG